MNMQDLPELLERDFSHIREESIKLALELAQAYGFAFVFGLDGSIIFEEINLNPSSAAVNFGPAALSGMDSNGNPNYLKIIYPEDVVHVVQNLERIRILPVGEKITFEFRRMNKVGDVSWASATITSRMDRDEPVYIGAFIDISKEKEQEETLRLIETLSSLIQGVASRIETFETSEKILYEILNRIGNLIPQASATSIYFIEDNNLRHKMNVNFLTSSPGDSADEVVSLTERPVIRNIVENRTPVIVPDTDASEQWLRTEGGFEIMSYIGVPIVRNNEVYAVLNINSHIRNGLSDGDLRTISAIAEMIPVILKKESIATDDQIGIETEKLRDMLPQLTKLNMQLRLELDDANDELGRIMNILGRVVHDLKNPLAVILTSVEILRKYGEKLSTDKKSEKLSVITLMVNTLSEQVNDLLGYAKDKLGEKTLQLELVEFVSYVQKIVAPQQQLGAREITLSSSEEISLLMDTNLMKSVIDNLISNATKYSPEDSPVVITMTSDNSFATFSVQDFGIGIPEDSQNDIFNQFSRASNTEGIQGTGLGLFHAKRIVEMHNGSIWFESKEGVGSTFYIKLPITKEC